MVAGDQLVEQPQPLRSEFGAEPAHPGDVAARPIEAVDKAAFDRVVAAHEDDRDSTWSPPWPTSAELLPPVAAITAT